MKVHVNGHTFSAARVTGPTHNFLRVVFSQQPTELRIGRAPKTVESGADAELPPALLASINTALEEVKELWPVNGIYFPTVVELVPDDTPNAQQYAEMLRAIVAEAARQLDGSPSSP